MEMNGVKIDLDLFRKFQRDENQLQQKVNESMG